MTTLNVRIVFTPTGEEEVRVMPNSSATYAKINRIKRKPMWNAEII